MTILSEVQSNGSRNSSSYDVSDARTNINLNADTNDILDDRKISGCYNMFLISSLGVITSYMTWYVRWQLLGVITCCQHPLVKIFQLKHATNIWVLFHFKRYGSNIITPKIATTHANTTITKTRGGMICYNMLREREREGIEKMI